MDSGTVPFKLFNERLRYVKEKRLPIDAGIAPLNILLDRSRDDK
jgi:hypothetical protein